MHKIITFPLIAAFLFLMSGCATVRKQQEFEISGLRNQILVLENQIRAKDEEINNLKEARDLLMQDKEALGASVKRVSKKKVIPDAKSRPNIKQIQIALKNAGYSLGAIDGRMGRQTRNAIKAFQKANNLKVDGRMGENTWKLLSKYLDKQENRLRR